MSSVTEQQLATYIDALARPVTVAEVLPKRRRTPRPHWRAGLAIALCIGIIFVVVVVRAEPDSRVGTVNPNASLAERIAAGQWRKVADGIAADQDPYLVGAIGNRLVLFAQTDQIAVVNVTTGETKRAGSRTTPTVTARPDPNWEPRFPSIHGDGLYLRSSRSFERVDLENPQRRTLAPFPNPTISGFTLQDFDPTANQWRLLPSLPPSANSRAIAADGANRYVVAVEGDTVVMFTLDDGWVRTPSTFAEAGNRGMPISSATVSGDYVYALEISGRVFRYSRVSQSWDAQPIPAPEFTLGSRKRLVVVDELVIVLGTDAYAVYDPAAGQWFRGNLPGVLGATTIGDRIFGLDASGDVVELIY